MAMPLQLLSPTQEGDDTALGAAMRHGGAHMLLPGEKLAALARDACLTHAKRSSQRKHVSDALRDDLTFVLIEQWRGPVLGEAIGWLLDREQAKIDAEKPAQPQQRAAAASMATAERREDSQDQPVSDPEPIEFKTPTPIISWDREGRFANDESKASKAANALARTAVRISKLDGFYINGMRRIGDVTPDEAASWAAGREQDARFVRLLIAGLPLGKSDPIRKYITAEESDRLYAEAEKARLSV
jgi:hypothetical protein